MGTGAWPNPALMGSTRSPVSSASLTTNLPSNRCHHDTLVFRRCSTSRSRRGNRFFLRSAFLHIIPHIFAATVLPAYFVGRDCAFMRTILLPADRVEDRSTPHTRALFERERRVVPFQSVEQIVHQIVIYEGPLNAALEYSFLQPHHPAIVPSKLLHL